MVIMGMRSTGCVGLDSQCGTLEDLRRLKGKRHLPDDLGPLV
jgi:hypothetical protein